MITFTEQEMIDMLALANWHSARQLADGKWVALGTFIYTTAIVVGITLDGNIGSSYERRYCYPHMSDAAKALVQWDGKNHPPGPWVKLKGTYNGEFVDILNPDLTA